METPACCFTGPSLREHPLCPRSSPIWRGHGQASHFTAPTIASVVTMCRDHQRQSVAACPCRAQRVPTSRPCFHPASKRLLQTQRLRNKLSLLSSCKLQQGSAGQRSCAGQELPSETAPRRRHTLPSLPAVRKPFCRLEARVAGASVSRQCLRHTVCKLKTASRARAAPAAF